MSDSEHPSGQNLGRKEPTTTEIKDSHEISDEQIIENFAQQVLVETDNLRQSCHKKISESDKPQLFAAIRRLSVQHQDLKAGGMVDITGIVQNACHRILHGDAPCLTNTPIDELAGHLDFNRFWITTLDLGDQNTQQGMLSINITVPFGG